MFFSLSKIIWALLSPLNLIFLIFVLGMVVSLFSKVQGRSVLMLGFVMFAGFGLFPVGQYMLILLEKHHERPAALPDRVDGILVLGGTFNSSVSEGRGLPAMNEAAERVVDALALAQKHPNALVVFSGGNGKLVNNGRTEADDIALFLERVGFSEDNVIYEDESRNTYENIKLTKELILPQPGETWVLISSSYHLPRAYAVARKQKWGGIIPYPTDYRTSGDVSWIPSEFDFLENFYNLHVALHEYIGIAAYHFTGKITLPLR